MKYLKAINIPLGDLFERNGIVKWENFGFDPNVVKRLQLQRKLGAEYVQLVPISDETQFNSKLAELELIITNTPIETDSIEVITESQADALKVLMLAETDKATLVL